MFVKILASPPQIETHASESIDSSISETTSMMNSKIVHCMNPMCMIL